MVYGIGEHSLKNKQTYTISRKDKSKHIPVWKFWKRRRYIIALLIFLGFFELNCITNLSIAIVAMTKENPVTLDNGTSSYQQEFNWSKTEQGHALSAFFYGFVLTQLPGGILGAKFGGNVVFGIGVIAPAILTLITPFVVNISYYLFLAVRFGAGFFEGVTFPCTLDIWSKWSPPLERSRMTSMAMFGAFLGTMFSDLISPYLVDKLGWRSIFFIYGGTGILWSIIWFTTVAESPEADKSISSEELTYIKESLENINTVPNMNYPWKSIFTSLPFWAAATAHFAENWCMNYQLTQLPMLFTDALFFDLKQAGILAALSFLVKAITTSTSGHLADMVQVKGYLSATRTRKVFTCCSHMIQSLLWIAGGFWFSQNVTPWCLICASGIGGFSWAGFSVNYLEIAPQYVSATVGLGNTISVLPGVISPSLSGFVIEGKDPSKWSVVLYIAGGICLLGCIIYAFLASAEIQPWAIEKEDKKQDSTETHQENA